MATDSFINNGLHGAVPFGACNEAGKEKSSAAVVPLASLASRGRYDLIVADPPWMFKSYSKKGQARAPESHYQTQDLDWICSLPVADLAAPDCHLMLWINGVSLVAGYHIKVLEAWGFTPSSMAFVWVKNNKHPSKKKLTSAVPVIGNGVTSADFFMGLGKTTRQNAEYVILGRRGKPKRESKAVHQIIVEPRREHSRKPEAFYDSAVEYVGKGKRMIELFSRTPREGWDSWGDEEMKFAPQLIGDPNVK